MAFFWRSLVYYIYIYIYIYILDSARRSAKTVASLFRNSKQIPQIVPQLFREPSPHVVSEPQKNIATMRCAAYRLRRVLPPLNTNMLVNTNMLANTNMLSHKDTNDADEMLSNDADDIYTIYKYIYIYIYISK